MEQCSHPVCQAQHGQNIEELHWHPNGPTISHIPLPVADPTRQWGCEGCSTCKTGCTGHYKTEFIDTNDPKALSKAALPPSTILKEEFSRLESTTFTDQFLEDTAKTVNLSTEETRIWLEHLATVVENRKRGAIKAAATRQKKKLSAKVVSHPAIEVQQTPQTVHTNEGPLEDKWYCGTCGKEYQSSSTEQDFWVACDLCDKWFCCACEGLKTEPSSQFYFCIKCS